MKNRYGKEYWFERVDATTYRFHMEEGAINCSRFGGRPYQDEMDMDDLGFFDPPGGPFICVGGRVEARPIAQIKSNSEGIFVIVE